MNPVLWTIRRVVITGICLILSVGLVGSAEGAEGEPQQPLPGLSGLTESPAREAILVDMSTGTVLYAKNPDQRMPTASMSKTMTAYMVFDALKKGRLTLDKKITISERAWRMQGSKTFVELGNEIPVEDLIYGMLIQSGNDATVALAEAIGGTEEGFAAMATARAREMGLTHSNFANATGWPDPNHYSTARDLAVLAERIIRDFPQYYHYFSEKEFTYHGIKQQNRDPLLRMNIGADGLKTGHTEESGYGLIGSASQNGRRLILVVNGLSSTEARADEAARLMKWGFGATGLFTLLKAAQPVDSAAVWMGASPRVPLVLHDDIVRAMTHEARAGMKVEVVLKEPVLAPIKAGQPLGALRLSAAGLGEEDIPLYAGADVRRMGFLGRFAAKFRHYVWGE